MPNDLNARMEIDHVIRVHTDGMVTDAIHETPPVYAPEIHCDHSGPFADAQISRKHTAAMVDYVKAQGWTLQTGWSGQYLTRADDPIMHPSEFIGGSLADHIRETPGYWVACSVDLYPNEDDPEYDDGNGENDPAGWVLAFRPLPESGPPNGPEISGQQWRSLGGIVTNF